jgi:uncharacterized protein YqjF (DUF2071 family)
VPVPIAFDWQNLLFEHYPVDPALVTPTLPEGLSVDTYDGRAWLSVVPFVNAAVRPRGLPRPLGLDLPELNLRTYVTHPDGPGVYFYSLDADGVLGVAGARLFHHLPYFYARMSLRTDGEAVRLVSKRRHPGARPAEYAASYEPTGEVYRADPGSLDEFLTERYRYYAASPGGLRYADVSHDPWPLQDARAAVDRNTLFRANGFAMPDEEPIRHFARSLSVTASRSKRVD